MSEVASAVMTWLLRIFVILTLAFYLLRDDHKIARWFRRNFRNYPTAVTFMEEVDDDLTTIYTGNLITIGATGFLAVVVYYGPDLVAPAGTGVPFPVLLGLLTGVATIIPAVGMKLVYFPYTGYLVWESVVGGLGQLWFAAISTTGSDPLPTAQTSSVRPLDGGRSRLPLASEHHHLDRLAPHGRGSVRTCRLRKVRPGH